MVKTLLPTPGFVAIKKNSRHKRSKLESTKLEANTPFIPKELGERFSLITSGNKPYNPFTALMPDAAGGKVNTVSG